MAHLSILMLIAASLLATDGEATRGSRVSRARAYASFVADARHTVRSERSLAIQHLWAGPDSPIGSRDDSSWWLKSTDSPSNRVSV